MRTEEYIKQHTRKGSNIFDPYAGYGRGCTPWLTVDDTVEVAKIAKEEVIEKASEWLKKNAAEYMYHCIAEECEYLDTDKLLKDFYKVMNK